MPTGEGDRYRTGPQTESVGPRPTGPGSTGKGSARSGASDADDSAGDERALVSAVVEEIDAIRGLAGALNAQADRLQRHGSERGDRRRRDAQERARRERAITGNRLAQAIVQTRSAVTELTNTLAPGPAAWPLHDRRWEELPTIEDGGPTTVRAGTLRLPSGKVLNEPVTVPFLLPLLDTAGVVIEVDEASRQVGEALIRSALLRLLAAAPPGAVEVRWFDPQLRGRLASFVSELQDEGLVRSAIVEPEQLEISLTELTQAIVRVSEERRGIHPTLSSLNTASGQLIEPHRVLVIMDHPAGLNERTGAQLQRIAYQGASSGVSIVLLHVVDAASRNLPREDLPQEIVDPTLLAPAATEVRGCGEQWHLPGLHHLALEPDDDPNDALVAMVGRQLREAAATAAAPRLALDDVLPGREERWNASSARGLSVPIGRAGTESCAFTLGDSVEQQHNVLVGGAIGQGKSNLLLTMIHSVAARYGPDEVEFQLLDFKEGVEFRPLAGTPDRPWSLPHADVLALESDRAFGREVLRELTAEFHRRAQRFKAAEANNVQTFRERDPNTRMPRIITVIDEVQVLFENDDAITEECAQLLDQIARKGRAYGIHLILGSQTLSGIGGLVTKLDAILAQFSVRLALKTNRSESQVLLEQGNTAAAELRYRGEVIVNTATGSSGGNVRAVVAYAEQSRLDTLRRELWEDAGGPDPPHLFEGGRPASLAAIDPGLFAGLDHQPTPLAWTGQPVGLERTPAGFPLTAEPGRHLAFVGSAGMGAPGAMAVAMATAARSAPDAQIFMIDAAPAEAGTPLTSLVEALRAHGRDVTHYDAENAAGALGELEEELERRAAGAEGGRILVAVAAPERIPKLEQFDLSSGTRPADTLRTIVRAGALHGIHLLGWWGGYRSLAEQIDGNLDTAGLLQGFVFVNVPRADVADALGPLVEWEPAPHRALVADRRHADGGRLVVPFESPTPEDLSRVLSTEAAR